MNGMLTGVVVTVLAGSVGLYNAHGAIEAESGRTAVLAPSQAPLFVAQDDPETLLRRLEALAAAISRIEAEISKLEAFNAKLKTQLKNGVDGNRKVYFGGSGGRAAGFRVLKKGGNTLQVETVILQGSTPSKKKKER